MDTLGMITYKSFIQKWLKLRQKCLVSFYELCHGRPFASQNPASLDAQLQEFCNDLIDYLSFGHFVGLEQLCMVLEKNQLYRIPHSSLNEFNLNTQYALGFCEHIASTEYRTPLLEQELSELCEALAKRFEWEDRFITLANQGSYSSKYSILPDTPFHLSASGNGS